jgi:3-hydroxybutyryl-CoA dehydrogenase
MKIDDIKRVLILGAGTMGQQIGLQCAMHGYDVVYYDISQEILDKALRRVAKLGAWYVSTGRLTEETLQHALARISATPDPARAAQDVDFVSESVPEDPEVKGKGFGQFHKLCPERTIFTTNTSMLVLHVCRAAGPENWPLHFHDLGEQYRGCHAAPAAPQVVGLVRDFANARADVIIPSGE